MKEKITLIYFVAFYLFSSNFLLAQAPEIEWQRTLFNSVPIYPNKYFNFQLSDGILIIGNTQGCDSITGGSHGDMDFFALKIDFNGNIKWKRIFGGSGYDGLNSADICLDSKRIFISYSTSSVDAEFSYLSESDFSETGIIILDFNGNEIKRLRNSAVIQDNFGNTVLRSQKNIIPNLGQKSLNPIFLKYSGDSKRIYIWTNLRDGSDPDDPFRFGRTILMSWDIDFQNSSYCILSNENVEKIGFSDRLPVNIFSLDFDNGGGIYITLNQFLKKIRYEKGAYSMEITIPNFNETSHKNSSFAMSSKSCILKLSSDLDFITSTGTGVGFGETPFKIASENSLRIVDLSSRNNGISESKKNGWNDLLITRFNNTLTAMWQYQIATAKNEIPCELISNSRGDYSIALFNSTQSIDWSKNKSDKNANAQVFPTIDNLSPQNILNSDSNASGIKLIEINKDFVFRKANFNIDDKDAKIYKFRDNEYIISACITNNASFYPVLIGYDIKQSRVLWICKPGNNKNEKLIDVMPLDTSSFILIGLKEANNASTGDKLWLSKFTLSSSAEKNKAFFDNLNPSSLTDSSIINSILLEKINSDSLIYFRNISYSIFLKDTSNISALQAFCFLTESLGDYDLAARAYNLLLAKTDKIKKKAYYSKFRAHQITCKFLSQSQKRKEEIRKEPPQWATFGYFGAGVKFEVLNKHLIITNILEGWPAYYSAIKPFDEIIAVNNIPVSNSCLNYQSAKNKIGGNKKSSATYLIKSFGENQTHDLILDRVFIPEQNSNVIGRTPDSKPLYEPTPQSIAEKNIQAKNTFLKSIVSSIEQDTAFTKNIEIVKKINYALSLLNKWALEPINKKYFKQFDEQIGMVASLLNIIKGSGGNFLTSEGNKILIDNQDLKELASNDFSKNEKLQFDATAHTQPVKETKIDNNITFVEKNKLDSYSGYYQCEDMFYEKMQEGYKQTECNSSDTWQSYTKEELIPYPNNGSYSTTHEYKNSLVKIVFTDNSIQIDYTKETKLLPFGYHYNITDQCKCETSFDGNYNKIVTVGRGTINITTMESNTEYTNNFYFKNGSSHGSCVGANQMVQSICNAGLANLPARESSNSSNSTVQQKIELIEKNRIKLTSNYGWVIYKKVKDL